jgi:hypothetical protein
MEMLSIHFSKQRFTSAFKTNANLVTFLSTTIALMLTIFFQGLIQGNLKPEYFGYAVIVSTAFFIWAVIDQKYR